MKCKKKLIPHASSQHQSPKRSRPTKLKSRLTGSKKSFLERTERLRKSQISPKEIKIAHFPGKRATHSKVTNAINKMFGVVQTRSPNKKLDIEVGELESLISTWRTPQQKEILNPERDLPDNQFTVPSDIMTTHLRRRSQYRSPGRTTKNS